MNEQISVTPRIHQRQGSSKSNHFWIWLLVPVAGIAFGGWLGSVAYLNDLSTWRVIGNGWYQDVTSRRMVARSDSIQSYAIESGLFYFLFYGGLASVVTAMLVAVAQVGISMNRRKSTSTIVNPHHDGVKIVTENEVPEGQEALLVDENFLPITPPRTSEAIVIRCARCHCEWNYSTSLFALNPFCVRCGERLDEVV